MGTGGVELAAGVVQLVDSNSSSDAGYQGIDEVVSHRQRQRPQSLAAMGPCSSSLIQLWASRSKEARQLAVGSQLAAMVAHQTTM
jgi:hypothetical protein